MARYAEFISIAGWLQTILVDRIIKLPVEKHGRLLFPRLDIDAAQKQV